MNLYQEQVIRKLYKEIDEIDTFKPSNLRVVIPRGVAVPGGLREYAAHVNRRFTYLWPTRLGNVYVITKRQSI